MDCLIYFRIASDTTRNGMFDIIKCIVSKPRYKHYLIKIEDVDLFANTDNGLCKCLVDFFSMNKLEENDELYIYYWSLATIGVVRLKKKGQLRLTEVHKKMQGPEASLGAMLGVLEY